MKNKIKSPLRLPEAKTRTDPKDQSLYFLIPFNTILFFVVTFSIYLLHEWIKIKKDLVPVPCLMSEKPKPGNGLEMGRRSDKVTPLVREGIAHGGKELLEKDGDLKNLLAYAQ